MIKREDLVAAASAGVLQCRQVEPLLVFLLQNEVLNKRRQMQRETVARPTCGLNRWLALGVGTMVLLTAMLFTALLATRAMLPDGLLTAFALAYAAAALALASWFRWRGTRLGGRLRILLAAVLASLPIAMLALQQANY